MAILFRPVTKDSLGNYEIEVYNGTSRYADIMKKTPMNIVNGVMVFFYHLSKELEIHILKCSRGEQVRDKRLLTTLQNGDGMLPSMQ